MALSEQERKLLEQLEASLKADDPVFADTLSGRTQIRVHRRRATLAGLGFLLGLAALLGGIQIHWLVSVAGFALMLVGAIIGIGSWQRVSEDGSPVTPSSDGGDSGPEGFGQPSSDSSDFMEKLEERWKKRQQGEM